MSTDVLLAEIDHVPQLGTAGKSTAEANPEGTLVALDGVPNGRRLALTPPIVESAVPAASATAFGSEPCERIFAAINHPIRLKKPMGIFIHSKSRSAALSNK